MDSPMLTSARAGGPLCPSGPFSGDLLKVSVFVPLPQVRAYAM